MDSKIINERKYKNLQVGKESNSYTKLDKIYRLYSPDSIVRNPTPRINQENKHKEKHSVIQLVFPHPNLLFIHPQKIKDQTQKHAFMEFNMMKNIVERKKNSTSMNSTRFLRKPMTAPPQSRNKEKIFSTNEIRKSVNGDGIKLYNFMNDNQTSNTQKFTSTFQTRKSKAMTSKTKCNKTSTSFKQNIQYQQTHQKGFHNQFLNKNTFSYKFEQQKKSIQKKYHQDKILRQKMYQKVLKTPKTQYYINMEGKFMKFFKRK